MRSSVVQQQSTHYIILKSKQNYRTIQMKLYQLQISKNEERRFILKLFSKRNPQRCQKQTLTHHPHMVSGIEETKLSDKQKALFNNSRASFLFQED